MFFGAQTFANTAFADPNVSNLFVAVTGQRLDISTSLATALANARVLPVGSELETSIGNVSFRFVVRVTGVEIQVANNTADVIIWNDVPVDPGNNWVAIDPNSVVSYTDINPGATQVWEDIDPLDP